ncbi:porphobilinogen deaminase [Drosophila tropicalis]|uniref:porphobilinogen deaminase n=1 Tax=Drosophila tropicalis TaxID=46794 RepID=UPI0035ABFAFD
MSIQEKVIRVGSRKSELALIQTKHVIGRLQKLYPKQKFEIHTMSTFGDRVLNISLPKIGEKSLFTRDLEDALRNGGVDFVVHSLKDLPTALPTGMAIGAVLEREDARDALVLRENFKGHSIATLPKGSVIGTSSLRRTAQIRRQYPHLVVCDIRGNLNTRLAKLDAADSKFSGIILAQAGLVRMGWMNRISQVLEPTDLLYAVGQGALAVECRANDGPVLDMLQKLLCLNTTCRILAERSFLKTLGGGCSAPVAVWSKLKGEPMTANSQDVDLSLTGAVWSLDGAIEIREHLACALSEKDNNVQEQQQQQRKRGQGGQDVQLEADESNSNSLDSPPATKRARNGNYTPPGSNESSPRQRGSPPVICEDGITPETVSNFSMEQLLERHIDLARQCPVVGLAGDNNNLHEGAGGDGGGDADTTNANANAQPPHCPLQMTVGQDFMGECPFVNNETKISFAKVGKCPVTHTGIDTGAAAVAAAVSELPTPPSSRASIGSSIGDEPDNVATSSKCPFASMHKGSGLEMPPHNNNSANAASAAATAKCPFLQKTVKMFDYADEEQPKPQPLPVLIEDVDNLFCGLYQHACYSREIYAKILSIG